MKIISVQKDSLGAELRLQQGDTVEAINRTRVKDILDYRFKIADEHILLRVRQNGKLIEYDLEKDADDDLGLEFKDMRIRKCANDCIFCFVDQNPKGMRQALYFRDGDFRLSFLHGHYITLTNMGWKELERVVEQRLSPLYISVHVTDPAKRKKMFLYEKDDFLLKKLEYLTGKGIELHSQIVLCPDWNDGEYLEQTISDLHRFSPMSKSVSIVPAGLTKHRDGLTYIKPITRKYSEKTIALYNEFDNRFKHSDGSRFVILSDEWYLRIGENVPTKDHYGNLELEENGVGQVRKFIEQWEETDCPKIDEKITVTIGSGILISQIFNQWFIPKLNAIPNLTVNYIPIKNELYGESEVTVSGLLSGGSIVNQLKGKALGDKVIFSDRIVNETSGEKTLDDVTLNEISNEIGVPFAVSPDEPEHFFNVLLN